MYLSPVNVTAPPRGLASGPLFVRNCSLILEKFSLFPRVGNSMNLVRDSRMLGSTEICETPENLHNSLFFPCLSGKSGRDGFA
jgi:hypothetical protein